MEIGCCVSLDRLALLDAAGADYAELSVASTVMAGASEDDFAQVLEQTAGSRIKPRAYNVFLPGDLPAVGPAVDRERLEGYARTAFGRVRRLGGAMIVFGSGRSRSIPEGFSREAALDQLEDFLRWMPALAAEYGITIALEPLRRAESNVFNSLREGAAFIRGRGLGQVRLLADIYHMMEEDEPLVAIDECADLIVHAHAADSGRQAPGLGNYPLAEFFGRLRQNGYGGDCSIECQWTDFPGQVGPSLDFLRRTAREAGWS